MKLNVLFLLILLSLISCQNKKEKADEPNEPATESGLKLLEKEVNKIHDEVMPKRNDLYKWKNKLRALDSVKSISPEKRKEIQSVIQKIDSADDAMMDWMHQFKPKEHVPDGDAREYLEDEMQKIQKVKADILAAIEKAKSVVESENEGKRQ